MKAKRLRRFRYSWAKNKFARLIASGWLPFSFLRLDCGMEEFVDIQCPYCGQVFEIVIDTSVARQRFTTDCEVCCRPLEVTAQCKDGEVVTVEALGD
jgi:hypothetical protein